MDRNGSTVSTMPRQAEDTRALLNLQQAFARAVADDQSFDGIA